MEENEEKKDGIKWYEWNGKKVDKKQIWDWLQNETKLKELKVHTQKVKSGRKSKYLVAEQKLHAKFLVLRSDSKAVQ